MPIQNKKDYTANAYLYVCVYESSCVPFNLISCVIYLLSPPVCMCVPGARGCQNMALGFLELELTGSCELPRKC